MWLFMNTYQVILKQGNVVVAECTVDANDIHEAHAKAEKHYGLGRGTTLATIKQL